MWYWSDRTVNVGFLPSENLRAKALPWDSEKYMVRGELIVRTPLNASATSAGALLSNEVFVVPPYQREYSWLKDEVAEFWSDLKHALSDESYFLGLIILTEEDERKHVVDGQQRLITLALLATALYHETKKAGRDSLADRIEADFLKFIDYSTDEVCPRVSLSDEDDNATLQRIIKTGEVSASTAPDRDSLSSRITESYAFLRKSLSEDLSPDPFKRVGLWADFLTNKVYFAVFIHPDAASAYRVFEVINTRGRELTTADLLKNYVLSQTPLPDREARYRQWQNISKQFSPTGNNSFVQYIRHAVTSEWGHVLPKDLFDFISGRMSAVSRPSVPELIDLLERNLSVYLQMIDTSIAGPCEEETLKIFSALNDLGVISVRPLMLSILQAPDSLGGLREVLKLTVRRMVVGNLGTGNVERRFGETAKAIFDSKDWSVLHRELNDLNPRAPEFVDQLTKRALNKSVLFFIRHSVLQKCITPQTNGTLHFICPRQGEDWQGFSEEDLTFWAGTIGNTVISKLDRRPKGTLSWPEFKENLLPTAVDEEWVPQFRSLDAWTVQDVQRMGGELAKDAANVWFD